MRATLALALVACGGKSPPPETAPLTDTAAEQGPRPLDGPYSSLEEAPTPHGSERGSLYDAGPGGAFREAQLLVYKDPTAVVPPRCAVALRTDGGWYVGSMFACERKDDLTHMTIEALGIDLADDGARFRYQERVRHDDPKIDYDERIDERAMVIACVLEAGVPSCADAAPE